MCQGSTGQSGFQSQMPQGGMTKPAFSSTFNPSWQMDGYLGQNMGMKQMGPSMYQPWMDQKTYTPPQGGYTPPTRPPDFGPLPPNLPPQQPPGQPQQPPQQPPATPGTPSGIPGIPQHLMSQITMDQSGRMLYGPDRQAVKWDGTQLRFDDTPFNPGAGQFGQYGAPGAGGFSLDTTGGMNRISGGANGSQLFSPEGLNQGSNFAPQNFVNYLNSYRR